MPRGVGGAEILTREGSTCVSSTSDAGLADSTCFAPWSNRSIECPGHSSTRNGSFDPCVEAVRLGAFQFHRQGREMERVVHEVRLALRTTDLRQRGRVGGRFTGRLR